MKFSPLRILQLSFLFISITSTVSCSKDHDLMTEYVVSAAMSPSDVVMLTMDDFDTTDANGNPILDAFSKAIPAGEVPFTEAGTATPSTIEIDDVTNTIIYTPAIENGISAKKVSGTLSK